MKKFILNIILILVLISIHQSKIYAQSTGILIPGVDCGNAESTGSARACCKIVAPSWSIPGIIKTIPFLGIWVTDVNNSMSKLQNLSNISPCLIGYPNPDPKDPNCICILTDQITLAPIKAVEKICEQYLITKEKNDCIDCSKQGGYWSALGCVSGDLSKFIIETVFGLGIGLAGIVAIICIIFSSLQLQVSQGNPEKLKKAQELLISCISGLILIIFSVFILKIIGINILRMPIF